MRPEASGRRELYASGTLPPAAMQPEPLLRIFANPAFDHRGDRLRCTLNVDPALGIAHRGNLLGQLGPESMVGQAYDAHAMDRTFDLAEQAGQHRVGFGLAAEEGDLDATCQILVDQHADMLAFLQRLGETQRRVAP